MAREQREAAVAESEVSAQDDWLARSVVGVSARHGWGLQGLWERIAACAAPEPWVYPGRQGGASTLRLEEVVHESVREKLLKVLHGDTARRCTQRLRGVRLEKGEGGADVLRVQLDVLLPTPAEVRMLKGRGMGPLRAIARGLERDLRAHTGTEQVHALIHAAQLKGQAAMAFK